MSDLDDYSYIIQDKGGGYRAYICYLVDNINYKNEIYKMEELYFSKKIENILLLANKKLSFDKKLKGDFNLDDNLINKNGEKEFIYIGCQIISKKLFYRNKIESFSILEVWNNLLENKKLYGYESYKDFYHLTDLNIFKKLKDL